jgi:hypothetical protein
MCSSREYENRAKNYENQAPELSSKQEKSVRWFGEIGKLVFMQFVRKFKNQNLENQNRKPNRISTEKLNVKIVANLLGKKITSVCWKIFRKNKRKYLTPAMRPCQRS